ncbi:hypothetical protein ILUMI_00380 [Ignelater luminosus]|uniref:HAT C-terminal dimerisation domain-containing protein n=1 Tax=Ignelater luminosus TaxID=2038154 RepID=A0A8K0DSR4_IGNLU|nr:hypothetical protein ILUMI_00380 [Ignelater luminosus]
MDYYKDNFEKIKQIIDMFSPEESISISEAQETLRNKTLKRELVYIASNFTFLSNSITSLESSGETLYSSRQVISKVEERLNKAKGESAIAVQRKLDAVLKNNPDYATLKSIANILNSIEEEIPENAQPSLTSYFTYVPVTTVDVERLFSAYKLVLNYNRMQFKMENLEMLLVIYCKANYNNSIDVI